METCLSHVVLNLLFFFLIEGYAISLSDDCVVLPYLLCRSTGGPKLHVFLFLFISRKKFCLENWKVLEEYAVDYSRSSLVVIE